MKILALGDIIAPAAVDYLCRRLPEVRRNMGIDLVVVNAENASFLAGIRPEAAERLLEAGADVLTGGNHTMQTRDAWEMLDNNPRVLRPINYPADVPGYGSTVIEAGEARVLVLNAMGTALIEPVLDSPYPYLERALERARGEYDFALLDFHAEATGEKYAVAHAFDGRIAAIWGTHTHVPTADEQILPAGTGYITDLGCVAPTGGIMGVQTEVICERMKKHLPASYRVARGEVRAEGAVFDIDETHGRCRSIERITF